MNNAVFNENNIVLNAKFDNKWDAIRACGQILLDNGYIKDGYIDDMVAREESSTTFIGNNVSIPHGLLNSDNNIIASGISFLQVPEGVPFGDDKAYMLIGIAGKGGTHLDMLGCIALACSDMDNIEKLRKTTDKKEVVDMFSDIDSVV